MQAMCGRVRLATDYSETEIQVKFDAAYPAPNIPASWNVCPPDPMLVAVRSQDGKQIPQQMRWGLSRGGRRISRLASLRSMRDGASRTDTPCDRRSRKATRDRIVLQCFIGSSDIGDELVRTGTCLRLVEVFGRLLSSPPRGPRVFGATDQVTSPTSGLTVASQAARCGLKGR